MVHASDMGPILMINLKEESPLYTLGFLRDPVGC